MSAVTIIATTGRLRLRRLHPGDWAFMLELLNEPGWLEFIGDRGVHNEREARQYIVERIQGQYDRYGYGMYGVELRASGEVVGLVGLVKRDYLADPDLGFALLDRYAGQGLALEAATAVLEHARALELPKLLAITVPANRRSIQLLTRLGFLRNGDVQVPGDTAPLQLYARATG